MTIKLIQCNMVAENCYIVSDETKECAIIDCGAFSVMEQQAISEYITQNGLKPVLHLLTHGHFAAGDMRTRRRAVQGFPQ